MDELRHACFGNVRHEGSQEAVENFVTCWENAGMGVRVKAHVIQRHLMMKGLEFGPSRELRAVMQRLKRFMNGIRTKAMDY